MPKYVCIRECIQWHTHFKEGDHVIPLKSDGPPWKVNFDLVDEMGEDGPFFIDDIEAVNKAKAAEEMARVAAEEAKLAALEKEREAQAAEIERLKAELNRAKESPPAEEMKPKGKPGPKPKGD